MIVQEKLTLPERTKDAAEKVSDQEPPPLITVTVYRDSKVKIDHDLLELKDPNSIETYDAIKTTLDELSEKIGRKGIEEAHGVEVEMPVTIKSDKEAPSGVVLQVIMACMDAGITPQIIFEETQIWPEGNE